MSALAFRTTDYLAVTGWPALVFLALKAEAVIYLLYGAAWLPAAPVLPPLCIAAGITIFASQTTAVYEGTGAAGLHLRNHALALAVAVALLAIGVQYSLLAVAWLRVPAIAARVFLDFSVFRRYARIEFGQMVWAVRRALLVTAGVALVLQGMILLEPPDTVRDPFILFAELAVAGAFYLGLLFVLRHSIRCEVVRVLTRLVARFRAGR
jgi:O-antigen/teichoic acid export membrane protein